MSIYEERLRKIKDQILRSNNPNKIDLLKLVNETSKVNIKKAIAIAEFYVKK